MNNMKKEIFTGTINGKQYNDFTQFSKDLGNTEDFKSVNFSLKNIECDEQPETDCKCTNCQKEIDMEDLTPEQKAKVQHLDNMLNEIFGQSMTDIFGSFLKAFQEDKIIKPVEKHEDEPTQDNVHFMSYDEIVEKYVLPETTYKFTGGAQDEYELDKFDRHLQKLVVEFAQDEWDDDVDVDALKNMFINLIDKYNKQIESFEESLHLLDEKIADLETIIDLKKKYPALNSSEEETYYDYSTTDFDKTTNHESYVRLLVEYYKELLKYIK